MKAPIKNIIIFAVLFTSFLSCKPDKTSVGKGMISFNIENITNNINLLENIFGFLINSANLIGCEILKII